MTSFKYFGVYYTFNTCMFLHSSIWNLKNPIIHFLLQNLQIPVIRSLWQYRNEGEIETRLRSRPEQISNSPRSFPPLRRPDCETPTFRLTTIWTMRYLLSLYFKYLSFCLLGKVRRALHRTEEVEESFLCRVKYATYNWHHHKMTITQR